jgi:predicted nuclease of restriction endonuclease-like RecB superfamily
MLTGDLVRFRVSKERVIPLYLDRNSSHWLEIAESLLLIFRESVSMTRGEIEEQTNALFGGGGKATLVHRGLAKVLEDRAEFEVVADVPPETIREKVFSAAAEYRRQLASQTAASLEAHGHRPEFVADRVLESVAADLGIPGASILGGLFADLRDENRLLSFEDMTAQRLIDRYNVSLAQAVLLRSVQVRAEVRGDKPVRYRALFRRLKFHRLLYRVEGSMREGYVFHIDGPLSLFSATTKYGLQMALFLPSLLLCNEFRLDAELRWGPRREPRSFHLESSDGLISHQSDTGTFVPAEVGAFVERFRQVAPAWDLTDSTEVLELGREGVWVPDYRAVHRSTGIDVFIEIVGFWKKSSLERLLRLLPQLGPERHVLAISDRLKVDEEAIAAVNGPILRFKEIPNASELASLLDGFLPSRLNSPMLFGTEEAASAAAFPQQDGESPQAPKKRAARKKKPRPGSDSSNSSPGEDS